MENAKPKATAWPSLAYNSPDGEVKSCLQGRGRLALADWELSGVGNGVQISRPKRAKTRRGLSSVKFDDAA